ncbi:MAG: T9SS type A sorting domain-containing protein, partial [Bacteroidota bacterium]
LVGDSGDEYPVYSGTVNFSLDEFHHFTTSNSDLISDTVFGLATHPTSDEVWLVTPGGLSKLSGDGAITNVFNSEIGGYFKYNGFRYMSKPSINRAGLLTGCISKFNSSDYATLILNTNSFEEKVYDKSHHPGLGGHVCSFFNEVEHELLIAYSGKLLVINGISSVDEKKISEVGIYPNPVGELLELVSLPEGIVNIRITSMNGRVIKEVTEPNGIGKIPVSDLSKGIYFIQCFDKNGRLSTTGTFIKE